MNPIICPSILAADADSYHQQIERVAGFAPRLQIDLSDGKFAPHRTIAANEAWWPVGLSADIHLMFERPEAAVEALLPHKPNLIIVHVESSCDLAQLKNSCDQAGVKLGVAILPSTEVGAIGDWLSQASHALVFSGELGSFGGHADLRLLHKVAAIKERNAQIEIGWDGGINDQNVASLAAGGVNVLDVGGFIQNSTDPERTFQALQRIADETGTT